MDVRAKNRSRLWDSLEMHCVLRDFAIWSVIALISKPLGDRQIDGAGWFYMALFLPFVLFYLIRAVQILGKPESYRFYKTQLTQPHQKYPLKSMCFKVVLEDEGVRRYIVDTHAIFAAHGIIGPLMEDYVDRTVTVAYNKETGMVVVIG